MEFLNAMLQLRPEARASAVELLAHPWLEEVRGAYTGRLEKLEAAEAGVA